MGQRVNVTTAARVTGRSERTLRDWLAESPCPLSVQLGPFRGGRKGEAGRTRWLDVDELRRLHEARGGTTWHVEQLPSADLDALRAEVAALREEVASLRGGRDATTRAAYDRQGLASPSSGILAPARSESALRGVQGHMPRQRVPTRPIGSTEALPGGLIAWRSFAKLHGIPATTASKAIETGRLSIVAGKWKQGRNYVEGALDASGRHAFVREWGHRPDFRACPDCPHDLSEAPAAVGE